MMEQILCFFALLKKQNQQGSSACMRQPLLFYQTIFSTAYTGYCSWPRLCGCGGCVPGTQLVPSQPAPGRRSVRIDANHLLWWPRMGSTGRRWDCAAPEGIGILPRPGGTAHTHTAAGYTPPIFLPSLQSYIFFRSVFSHQSLWGFFLRRLFPCPGVFVPYSYF